jgi:flavin reductase (DIM6/NTAB) family NADH-FMN oxidoreductase RutF
MKRSLGPGTLVGTTPVWVIGTYDSANVPNLMTAAWVGVACSKPPALSVSLREATYTYGNIVDRKAFTVGIPSAHHVREVDFLGIASGREADKLARAGLTAVKSDLVDAPYVAEFRVSFECRLLDTLRLGLHTLFVGEVIDAKAEDEVLVGGVPSIERLAPLLFSVGEQAYYGTGAHLGSAFRLGRDILRGG